MASEKRKAQLQEIKGRLKNPELSLLEVANFGNMMMAIYANNPPQTPEEVTKEEHFLACEVSASVDNKFISFIDRWNRGEIKPDEKELKFLKRFNSLIDHILAISKQQAEALKQLKHLSEDDKQKILKVNQKSQENWKKYQPILNDLIEKEERERVKKRKIRLVLPLKSKFPHQLLNPLILFPQIQIIRTKAPPGT